MVYVLHCFKKISATTSKHDKDITVARYKAVIQERSMSIETQSMHITKVGENVFADQGFEPAEAAVLQADPLPHTVNLFWR